MRLEASPVEVKQGGEMGIIECSVLGDISGKVGPFVFQKQKGKRIIKVYTKPKESNTPKQRNKKLTFGIVGHFVKVLRTSIIWPIWEPLVKRKQMTGGDYFSSLNVKRLNRSIPEPDKVYNRNNLPDMSKLFMSFGILEQTIKVELFYDKDSGIVKVLWDGRCFSNGSEDDKAYLVVMHWDISYRGLRYFSGKRKCGDGRFPITKPWSNSNIWGNGIEPVGIRKDCEASIVIDKDIRRGEIIGWVFFSQVQEFRNGRKRKVYSSSTSSYYTQTPKCLNT